MYIINKDPKTVISDWLIYYLDGWKSLTAVCFRFFFNDFFLECMLLHKHKHLRIKTNSTYTRDPHSLRRFFLGEGGVIVMHDRKRGYPSSISLFEILNNGRFWKKNGDLPNITCDLESWNIGSVLSVILICFQSFLNQDVLNGLKGALKLFFFSNW